MAALKLTTYLAFLSLVAITAFIWKQQASFRKNISDILSAMWLLRYFLLIYYWSFRFLLKSVVPAVQLLFLSSVAALTLSEIGARFGINFLNAQADHPTLLPKQGYTLPELQPYLEPILDFFERLSTLVALGLAEFMVLSHDLSEFRNRGRERTELSILRKLFGDLSPVNAKLSVANANERPECETAYRTLCSNAFVRILRERSIKDVDISLMQLNPDTKSLKIVFVTGDRDRFNLAFEPRPGEGAAGTSYQNRTIIYVPVIKWRHGIECKYANAATDEQQIKDQYEQTVIANVYRDVTPQPFKSMLCAPISFGAEATERGWVVNFSSPHRSAFSKSEFLLARLAVSIYASMN